MQISRVHYAAHLLDRVTSSGSVRPTYTLYSRKDAGSDADREQAGVKIDG